MFTAYGFCKLPFGIFYDKELPKNKEAIDHLLSLRIKKRRFIVSWFLPGRERLRVTRNYSTKNLLNECIHKIW